MVKLNREPGSQPPGVSSQLRASVWSFGGGGRKGGHSLPPAPASISQRKYKYQCLLLLEALLSLKL